MIRDENEEENQPLLPQFELRRQTNMTRFFMKHFGVALICGTSVILFALTTKNQPLIIKISGVGSNFILTWYSGWEAMSYFFPEKGKAVKSTCRKSLYILFTTLSSSLPSYFVTYNSAKELNESLRFMLGSLNFLGSIPLNCFAFSLFAKNLLEYLAEYKQAKYMLRCNRANDDLYIIQNEMSDLLIFMQLTFQQQRFSEIRRKYTLLCENNFAELTNFCSFEQRTIPVCSTSKYIDFLSWLFRFLGGLTVGTIITLGGSGYLCNTADALNFDDLTRWNIAILMLLGFFYLSFNAGWSIFTGIYDSVVNCYKTRIITKPIPLQLYQTFFERATLLFFLAVPTILDLWSGYTAEQFYLDYCPWTWQRGTVGKSMVAYNCIYTINIIKAAAVGKRFLFGTADERAYILVLNRLGNLAKEAKNDLLTFVTQYNLSDEKSEFHEQIFRTDKVRQAWMNHFNKRALISGNSTRSRDNTDNASSEWSQGMGK